MSKSPQMATSLASSALDSSNDGPVLSVINKRLRALRKKLNRISQMEESMSQGKNLNKEQDETLRSKSSVLAGIGELEKLRQPLCEALAQEISYALEKQGKTVTEKVREEAPEPAMKGGKNDDDVSSISDLLSLLYFGSVFDVRTLMRAHENMITRTHERSSCLTYDYVTDDDTDGDLLKEWDLDLIAMLGGLLISRPMNSTLTHKNALEKCVEHARLWLANSEQLIDSNSDITYAGLRAKLDKIMASEYITTIPAIKAPVEVSAANGNYKSSQVPVHGATIPIGVIAPLEGSASEYQQQEEESPDYHGNEIYDDKPGPDGVHQEGVQEQDNAYELQIQPESEIPNTEIEQNSREELDSNEQHLTSHGSYRSYRSGQGENGGGRRGYPYWRGGRGNGRGDYHNGHRQFYDQPDNYYPRNYNSRGRGGRVMGSDHGYHGSAGHTSHAHGT